MIKYIIIDVDGTLTDGKVYIGNNGELCKAFYVRDGIGIKKVKLAGIIPIILTSRESQIVLQRCMELGIDKIYQGVDNKKEKLVSIMHDYSLTPREIAYIADDINDLEAMKVAGNKGCPNDAVPEIRRICNFVCQHDGGNGAVREYCEYLINSKQSWGME